MHTSRYNRTRHAQPVSKAEFDFQSRAYAHTRAHACTYLHTPAGALTGAGDLVLIENNNLDRTS